LRNYINNFFRRDKKMINVNLNVNSVKNQKIKEKFVNMHVYACVTNMADYILKQDDTDAPFTSEDIQNYYTYFCANCGERISLDECEIDEDYAYVCPYCKESFYDPDYGVQEVYEWWIVSGFLGRKLESHGEPIVHDGYNYIWGRTCTGQAILLDNVISVICEELEILDGQKNEWEV